jgi:hypothetical protein
MTVAYRVNKFREDHPDWTIETELVSEDDIKVVMKAIISRTADNGTNTLVLATGYAEEVRAASSINKTSALEVCETSAIGRALAALGYAGTEYASADEVAGAISQQKVQEATDGLIKHLDAVRDEWPSIHAIKTFLSEETPNVDAAREAFKELDESIQHVLWRAPTKGGVFTTLERKLLKEGTA